MASQINITPASSVSNVAVTPGTTNINVTNSQNVSSVTVQATSNINVAVSRSVIGTPANINVNTANFANYAGNVTVSAQPNITSVGTLTNLAISGAITGNLIPASNVTYNLGNNTNRWNDLYM